MLALVNKPHIEIRGEIPDEFLTLIYDYFGKEAVDIVEDDDETLTPESSRWFEETPVSPGTAMKIYRKMHGMTQMELGDKLGGIETPEISKMETGKRNISIKTARKLAKLFDVSAERFI